MGLHLSEPPYVHRDSGDADGWRKLWVVQWQTDDGRTFEREHRKQAAADAHVFELGRTLGVVAVSVDGMRVL